MHLCLDMSICQSWLQRPWSKTLQHHADYIVDIIVSLQLAWMDARDVQNQARALAALMDTSLSTTITTGSFPASLTTVSIHGKQDDIMANPSNLCLSLVSIMASSFNHSRSVKSRSSISHPIIDYIFSLYYWSRLQSVLNYLISIIELLIQPFKDYW